MSCQVSLLCGLSVTHPQETVKDLNQVNMLILVLALLDVHEELNSASVVFKNSVNDEKSQCDYFVISLHTLDDLEEKSDEVFSNVFLYW